MIGGGDHDMENICSSSYVAVTPNLVYKVDWVSDEAYNTGKR